MSVGLGCAVRLQAIPRMVTQSRSYRRCSRSTRGQRRQSWQGLVLRVALWTFVARHDDERSDLSCKKLPRIHLASSTALSQCLEPWSTTTLRACAILMSPVLREKLPQASAKSDLAAGCIPWVGRVRGLT